MVAQKKGRGAKNQAKKPQQVEEQAEVETQENMEAEDNGEAEAVDQSLDTEGAGNGEGEGEGDGQDTAEPGADGEPKPEDKKEEEKVETGKILVENLPSSFLFDYQEKLKEIFSKHGEIVSVKRGPIIVTELTTTPTLSAIVEFKNKESLDKALSEDGSQADGRRLAVAVESRADTAVLVGVPYEAGTPYVRELFSQCGDVAHIHEFSKTKYKILRVTFHNKESVEKALKLDRELRINGFLVTVSKYRDEDEQKAHSANANKNKRQHPANQQNRNNANANNANNANRTNNFRQQRPNNNFSPRGNFGGGRGARGGFGARGGGAFRGGFAPINSYMPPQGFMGPGRPGLFNDGQRPNKRLRQM